MPSSMPPASAPGLWLSYLFVLFYFAIAAGAVTHRDLLLENPVKLPFLNVELPLKAFFILGPLVFLIVHTYVLLHFVLLAGKFGAFHWRIAGIKISGDDRARTTAPAIAEQHLSSNRWPGRARCAKGSVGSLLWLIIGISLVAGPIALLLLFQLQFLPYHSEWITNWQRIAIVIDLDIAVDLVAVDRARRNRPSRVAGLSSRPKVHVRGSRQAACRFCWWSRSRPSPVNGSRKICRQLRLVPTTWDGMDLAERSKRFKRRGSGWATLHELLVGGERSTL